MIENWMCTNLWPLFFVFNNIWSSTELRTLSFLRQMKKSFFLLVCKSQHSLHLHHSLAANEHTSFFVRSISTLSLSHTHTLAHLWWWTVVFSMLAEHDLVGAFFASNSDISPGFRKLIHSSSESWAITLSDKWDFRPKNARMYLQSNRMVWHWQWQFLCLCCSENPRPENGVKRSKKEK